MNEQGHAAVEFGLAAGLLLIPVALAVLSFGPWSERRVLAEAGAAESSRAAVIDLDLDAGRRVLAEMALNHGLSVEDVMLGWCGRAPAPIFDATAGCSMGRGTDVVSEVRVRVPLIETPWGPVGGLWATGVHREPIDLYRSLG
jgi:hypothetical protein